jgi:predicted metalloprotease with PDZ domain
VRSGPTGRVRAARIMEESLPRIRYRVGFPEPQRHVYHLELFLAGLPDRPFTLSMPVWTPGHYLVRDFSGQVFAFAAEDAEGRPLAWEKVRKDTWQVAAPGPGGEARIRYRVYAHTLSTSDSHLTADHAYWNGANLFMALDRRYDLPVEVTVDAPSGWQMATALPRVGEDGRTFRAPDFDLLVDSPFEVGTHRSLRFEAMGKEHEIALWGQGNEDPRRLVADVRRIVLTQGALFGELPYDRYLFILHLTDGRTDGLEHLFSTTCAVDRFAFRPESRYRHVLSLIAHEFFHLWNVKRIRPASLGPFDYGGENYTRLLWAMEGITDYYAWLTLVRAGLISVEAFLKELAEEVRRYEETPGRRVQSAAEASYDAWVKHYRPTEDSPNRTISYYRKGMLLGLGLDLSLRHRSQGQASLDEVMRALWRDYGRPGRGLGEGDWQRVAEAVAGESLEPFFARYVRGVEEYDPGEYLALAGLRLKRLHRPADPEAEEEEPEALERDHPPFGWLGLDLETKEGRLWVTHVRSDGPAADCGIAPGDELIGLDGHRVDRASLEQRLRTLAPGTSVRLDYAQEGRLRQASLVLGEAPAQRYRITAEAEATPAARRLRAEWLGQTWPRMA